MYSTGRGVTRDPTEAAKWLRRAAERGVAAAQTALGYAYTIGEGVPLDRAEAFKWTRLAAEQGDPKGEYHLGLMYQKGVGVPQDLAASMRWYRRASDHGYASAMTNIGSMYRTGEGVPRNFAEALWWYWRASYLGDPYATNNIGTMYELGQGVERDFATAYRMYDLAVTTWRGRSLDASVAEANRARVANLLLPPPTPPPPRASASGPSALPAPPSDVAAKVTPKTMSVGSGFMVSKSGHILTNAHVIEGCREVYTKLPSGQAMLASTVAQDLDNDLALLQVPASGSDVASFREGRAVRQGEAVVVVGFPLSGLLASGSSLTTGTVSALAGLRDNPTFLQITAPVQAGNSGGPLLDESGNVVGVVVGKLNALKVAGLTGDLPQNVNFAIHGTVARSFLDARGVRYGTALSRTKLEIPDVGDRARKFTVVLQCLQ